MASKKHIHRGDNGTTSVLGGISVSKADPLIAAIGDLDELDAHIAYIGDIIQKMAPDQHDFLVDVGHKMWHIKSSLARPAAPPLPASPPPMTPASPIATPPASPVAVPPTPPPTPTAAALASPTFQSRASLTGAIPALLLRGSQSVERKKVEDEDIADLERRIDALDAELRPLTHFILMGGHPAVSSIHIARTVCRRAERSLVATDRNTHVGPNVLRYINRLSLYLFSLARWVARQLDAEEVILTD